MPFMSAFFISGRLHGFRKVTLDWNSATLSHLLPHTHKMRTWTPNLTALTLLYWSRWMGENRSFLSGLQSESGEQLGGGLVASFWWESHMVCQSMRFSPVHYVALPCPLNCWCLVIGGWSTKWVVMPSSSVSIFLWSQQAKLNCHWSNN